MSRWFYFNSILLIAVLWAVFHKGFVLPERIHILFGLFGFMLILFNWTRHAVFSTIRTVPERGKKIKLANLSKRILPYHRWVGMSALTLIIIHAILVLNLFGFHFQNLKLVSGLFAGIVVICMVTTGWMRLIKPSGKKRRAHLRFGMLLIISISLHILL